MRFLDNAWHLLKTNCGRVGLNHRPRPYQSSAVRFYNNLQDRGDCQTTRKSHKTSHIAQDIAYCGLGCGLEKVHRLYVCDIRNSADSSFWCADGPRLLTKTSIAVVRWQPWFYLRLEAYSYFWLSEGAYG